MQSVMFQRIDNGNLCCWTYDRSSGIKVNRNGEVFVNGNYLGIGMKGEDYFEYYVVRRPWSTEEVEVDPSCVVVKGNKVFWAKLKRPPQMPKMAQMMLATGLWQKRSD